MHQKSISIDQLIHQTYSKMAIKHIIKHIYKHYYNKYNTGYKHIPLIYQLIFYIKGETKSSARLDFKPCTYIFILYVFRLGKVCVRAGEHFLWNIKSIAL